MPDLLQPGFLWLAALALPLVALYLLKARRRPQTVTALWLWRAAQKELEARVPLRKLRREWLLALQLLILALLVLAAAGPFRRALSGGDLVVVVDASASMLAEDRPAQLERALRGLVDGLGKDDRMALVKASARPEVLAPLTGDRRTLLAAAERARPTAAPVDLAPAVELAESLAGAGGTVVVISDPAGEVPKAAGQLEVVRVGQAADNVGIVALGVRPADTSGRDHQVFVRLRNASPRPASGTLRLLADGRVRDAAELTLPAAGEAGHTLRLVGLESAALEVRWQSDGGDALAADDRAFWVLEPPPERRYRLRGAIDPFLRRALESAGDWRRTSDRDAADLEILVGEAPAATGPPFLWLDPPAASFSEAAAVLRWDKTHPALRFVDLRAVRLGRVPRLERPAGARVLAESTAGPLVVEGSHHQRRYLMWAFDPVHTDLPLRVAWPLMVRHALEYLVPADGPLDGGVATGGAIAATPVPWRRAPAEPDAETSRGKRDVTLISPAGHEIVLTPQGGALHLPPLEEVGVWRLAEAEREMRFAASLLDAGESDLAAGSATRVVSAGQTNRAEPQRAALRGLWRPLIAAALLLLVLEAAAFHRRWSL